MHRIAVVLAFALMLAPIRAAGGVTVPFVGCASDGQVGPDSTPQGKPVSVKLDTALAAQFAFYQSKYDDGVLAPRGWHCANLEGSSGWILFVSPKPIAPRDFLMPRGRSVAGPIIQVSFDSGGTSGRFEAARIMARYFPQNRAFVQGVIAEGIEPAKYFPSGPFSGDKLVARSRRVVEYVTPPRSRGLGTMSRLEPDDSPISSAAMLLKDDDPQEPSALTIAVRLPKAIEDLAPIILRDTERRYAGSEAGGREK